MSRQHLVQCHNRPTHLFTHLRVSPQHKLTSISSILSSMLSSVGPCSRLSASVSATCCLSVVHRARAASSRRSSSTASLNTSALASGCSYLQHSTVASINKRWSLECKCEEKCEFLTLTAALSRCLRASLSAPATCCIRHRKKL